MSKKFGVSIGFLSALFIFTAWFSPAAILVITVLVLAVSDEEVLKRNVLNALFFSLFFLIFELILGKCSGVYQKVIGDMSNGSLFSFFDEGKRSFFARLDFAAIANNILGIIKTVIMAVYVFIAFKGEEVKIPFADSLAKKVMQID